MSNIRPLAQFLAAAVLLPAGAFAANETVAAPLPFSEAVFTEVVNDVSVVSRADAKAVKAVKAARFTAPDLVKTGRKSRAQLTGADGTIARVGSNAVFSFDKSSRTINLESGSVLFHSPTGKGGGTIVTNSATASVIGTTIIVTATADGGFKLLVLEGIAKVQYPNGQVATVNAGQMTFVMPGATVEKKSDGASGSSSQNGDKPAKGGAPGPVLNFDLASLAAGSGLVNGFATELPSLGKVRLATGAQQDRLTDGELKATGLFIVGARDDKEFLVADPTAVQQAQLLNHPDLLDEVRLNQAFHESFSFDGTRPIPEKYIFRTPVRILPAMLPAGITVPDENVVGVLIGHLELNTSVFNLGFIDGAADELTVAGVGVSTLVIPGDITFNGLAKSRSLRIAGGHLLIAPGAKVDVDFDNVVIGAPTKAEFVSLSDAHFTGVSFRNPTGSLELGALLGDLKLDNVTAVAGDKNATNIDPARLDLHVPAGSIVISGGDYRATGEVRAEASGDINASGATFATGGRVDFDAGAKVALAGTSVTGLGGVKTRSLGDFTASNSTISSSGQGVSIEAAHIGMTGSAVTTAGHVNLTGANGVTLDSTVSGDGGVNIASAAGAVNLGASTISSGTAAPVNFPSPIAGTNAGSGTLLINGAGGTNTTVPYTGGPLTPVAIVSTQPPIAPTAGIIVEGEGVQAGAAILQSGGFIRIDGRATGVTLNGATLSAANIDIDGDIIVLTGGALNATNLFIERTPGVAATSVTIDGTTFGALKTVIRANRLVLENTDFHTDSTATFRVTAGGLINLAVAGATPQDGHANFNNVTFGGGDVFTSGRVWAPAQNIGDVTAPLHILDFTTADFRGTKKDYALATPFTLNAASTFTPHSYEFDAGTLTLTNADLGLPAAVTLPVIGSDPSHSAYEVTGIFAANLTLNGATVDLARFDVDPLVNQYAHADIVARTLNLAGNITVTGLSQTGSLELRATSFNIASGTVFNPGFTGSGNVLVASATALTLPNFTLHNDAGSVTVLSQDALTVTGGSLGALGSIDLRAEPILRVDGGATIMTGSSVSLESSGDVVVIGSGTVIKAGYASLYASQGVRVDGGASIVAGNNINLSAGTGDVILNTTVSTVGSYDAQALNTVAGNFSASSTAGRIDIANSTLTVEGDSRLGYDTGTMVLSAPMVKLTGSTLKSFDTNLGRLGKYIEIDASAVVSINGGSLRASDIIVRGRTDYSGQTPVYNLLNRIDVDGVNFMANTVQDGSYRGVFLEAQTINISNTMFPEKTEIRLQSQNGTLNLGSANMFGAVNFVKGVGLRDSVNGDKILVDGSRIPNIANINMAVWVEGHDKTGANGVNKIFVNGVTPGTLIDGNPSATSAPIHIQQAMPTQASPSAGSHPSNFATGINGSVL